MKHPDTILKWKLFFLTAGMALTLSVPGRLGYAQNSVVVDINVDILEALVTQVISDLDFGTIGLNTAPGFAPALTINTDGSTTVSGEGGRASLSPFGGHAVARLDVDGPVAAAGATVNLEINNVSNLTGPGPDIFTLGNFTYNDQIANSGSIAVSTPEPVLLDGAGDAAILIGGRIDTVAAGGYGEATYSGSFDVIVFY